VVAVQDSGPGLNRRVFDRLFEPILQRPSPAAWAWGLSLCRSIGELTGPGMGLATSGPGMTFNFTLPWVRAYR